MSSLDAMSITHSIDDYELATIPRSLRRFKQARGNEDGEGKGNEAHVRGNPKSFLETVIFHDAVFSNRIFFQTLSAQDILRNMHLSTTWTAWTIDNIIDARCCDESLDWYYPLLSNRDFQLGRLRSLPPCAPQTLHGVWHANAQFSVKSKLCKLPLLPTWLLNECTCGRKTKKATTVIKANAGGLFLVEMVIASTCCRNVRGVPYRYRHEECNCTCSPWASLVVTNPLTNKYTILPDHASRLMSPNLQYHMTVDENANTYKVMVYKMMSTRPQLIVYNSRSQEWNSFILAPIQPSIGSSIGSNTLYASLWKGGKLYVADLRRVDDNGPSLVSVVLRLFAVEIRIGQLVLHTQLRLSKMKNSGVYKYWNDDAFNINTRILRNLELVECMGHLYAVIPARHDEILYHYNVEPKIVRDDVGLKYMPLKFHIFKLEKEGRHGVLHIENFKHLDRARSLWMKTWVPEHDILTPEQNWFSCTAKGNVIYVSIEDYLLQYDVLSGKCMTEILPLKDQLEIGQIVGVA